MHCLFHISGLFKFSKLYKYLLYHICSLHNNISNICLLTEITWQTSLHELFSCIFGCVYVHVLLVFKFVCNQLIMVIVCLCTMYVIMVIVCLCTMYVIMVIVCLCTMYVIMVIVCLCTMYVIMVIVCLCTMYTMYITIR